MAVNHGGASVPQLDFIWGLAERAWLVFVWDGFLSDSQTVTDHDFLLSGGFTLLAKEELVDYEYKGKVYSKAFAGLISHDGEGLNGTYEVNSISHVVTVSGGSIIPRTISVLVGEV